MSACRRSQSLTVPGTLCCVDGLGVLLQGSAGAGKSETALGLIDRGHKLVADDAVELVTTGDALEGHCPAPLHGLLAIRDLGVLDVTRLFGADSVQAQARIELIVRLQDQVGPSALSPRQQTQHLAGVALPQLLLGTSTRRNLPLLVETAARNFQLRRQGYHSDARLAAAQQDLLKEIG